MNGVNCMDDMNSMNNMKRMNGPGEKTAGVTVRRQKIRRDRTKMRLAVFLRRSGTYNNRCGYGRTHTTPERRKLCNACIPCLSFRVRLYIAGISFKV